jgi:hypothetical protein
MNRRLTELEMQHIRDYYPHHGAKKTASMMHRRTPGTVAAWACNNKIRVLPEVAKENRSRAGYAHTRDNRDEIDLAIMTTYPESGSRVLAEKFNVRQKYICSRAFQLGVKCDRETKSELMSKGAVKGHISRQGKPTTRQMLDRDLGRIGRLALYKPWRQDYPREKHEIVV